MNRKVTSALDRDSLLAHVNVQRKVLTRDVFLKQVGARETLDEVSALIESWSSRRVEDVWSKAGSCAVAYALARLVRSCPSFRPDRPTTWKDEKTIPSRKRRVVLGDLIVRQELDLSQARELVVLGNLTAPAIFADETSWLVVAGNAKVRVAGGDGGLLIGGNLEANAALGYDEAGSFVVSGTLRAQLALFQNHPWHIGKKAVTRFFTFWDEEEEEKGARRLERVVNIEALTEEADESDLTVGRVDLRALMRLVQEGEPALRAPGSVARRRAKPKAKVKAAPPKGGDWLVERFPDTSERQMTIPHWQSSIPATISRYKKLEHIWTKGSIESLPPEIGQLPELWYLNLNDSRKLKNLPPEIGKLPKLRALLLSGTGLTSLPETIGDLKELEHLDISRTKIQTLPASLRKLEKLKVVEVSACPVTEREVEKLLGRSCSR